MMHAPTPAPHRLRHVLAAGLCTAALLLGTAAPLGLLAPPAAAAAPADTARPELGRPLQAAQQAAGRKRYKDAFAELAKAEAVADPTPYERYLLAETRASVHLAAGQPAKAAAALEQALATGRMPPAERPRRLQVLAGLDYRLKDYRQAIVHANLAIRAGAPAADLRPLLAQAHYMAGDHRKAAALVGEMVAAAEQAGRRPDRETLELLLSVAHRTGDPAAYRDALRRLVTYYPTPQHWRDLLAAVQRQPGFSPALAVEADRLLLQVGAMTRPDAYMAFGQQLLLANLPGDAEAALTQGFATGALGVGQQSERHIRLLTMAQAEAAAQKARLQQAAPADLDAVTLGLAYASYGWPDRAAETLRRALAHATGRTAEHVRLDLGRVLITAGKPDEARAVLSRVGGTDGAADLARLWLLQGGGES